MFRAEGYAGALLTDHANAAVVGRPRLDEAFPANAAMYITIADRVIGEAATKRQTIHPLTLSIDYHFSDDEGRNRLETWTIAVDSAKAASKRIKTAYCAR